MALPVDADNPGTTSPADQAFDGLPVQVPSFGQVPASASPNAVDADDRTSVDGPISSSIATSGGPTDANQTIEVAPQQTPVTIVDGDDPSSVRGPISSSVATSGGPADANQTVEVAPQQTPVTIADGDDPSSVRGPISSSLTTSGGPSDANQTVDITPPLTAVTSVNGGTFSPQAVSTTNTTQNNVVGQTYGTGSPRNVFV